MSEIKFPSGLTAAEARGWIISTLNDWTLGIIDDDIDEVAIRIFAAGRASAISDAVGAVEKVECPDIFSYGIRLAIAAIKALEEK